MKKILWGCLTAILLTSSVQANDKFRKACEAILEQKLEHPYLVFDNQTKQQILDYIQQDRYAADVMDLIRQQGRRVMLTTLEPELPFNLTTSRYTETDPYQAYMTFYRQGALTLAFLYQMDGDEAYAQKAFDYARKLCLMENWVMAACYYEILYPRVWPYGAKDDQVVFSFDILAAECALTVALVYDWIYPAIDKDQRNHIRNGLLEKAVLRVRRNYEYHWWSEAYKCNWAGICHGGLGMAALALLTEDPQLIDVVIKSCVGYEGMIDQFGDDNGWPEGRHYSAYGFQQSMQFMDAIKRLTNGQIDLFDKPGLKHPADFALYGITGSFNDGARTGPVGVSFIFNKLAEESGCETAMYYLENYYTDRRSTSLWELIWPRPTGISAVKPAEASKHFTSVDWAFMRKDFGDEYLQVAVKSALAEDPHHGHLDAGSFNISWKGDVLIGEIEQRFYDQFFFNDIRFDYLYVKSSGHNVVLVNGEEQISAKRKDQPWLTGVGGKIEQFATHADYVYTTMDQTAAYPNQELKNWQRTVVLDKEHDIVLVLDRIGCAPGAKIDMLFHPRVDTEIRDDLSVRLTGNQTSMIMKPLVNQPFELYNRNQPIVRVVEKNPAQWIPCLYTSFTAESTQNIAATVFYPSDCETVTCTLDESGKHPVITYDVNGKTYRMEFQKEKVIRL